MLTETPILPDLCVGRVRAVLTYVSLYAPVRPCAPFLISGKLGVSNFTIGEPTSIS
ncbi:MAG TPA: hypothetical protein VI895_11115 [Bdellovibrionota bacterium]|nr:hypothetical protein [Bdellovibrionota bacterium]